MVKHRKDRFIAGLLVALAVIVFVINLLVLPKALALESRLKQTCSIRNRSIADSNYHRLAYERILLIQAGHLDLALELHDTPLVDCETGQEITAP